MPVLPLQVADMPKLSKQLAESPTPVIRKFFHSLAWHNRDAKDRAALLTIVMKEFKLQYVVTPKN